MSKGSTQRKSQVSKKQFDDNWGRAFSPKSTLASVLPKSLSGRERDSDDAKIDTNRERMVK